MHIHLGKREARMCMTLPNRSSLAEGANANAPFVRVLMARPRLRCSGAKQDQDQEHLMCHSTLKKKSRKLPVLMGSNESILKYNNLATGVAGPLEPSRNLCSEIGVIYFI
jgi:hypothetical protein